MPTPTVLLIDDSEEFRSIALSILLEEGYDVWDACCPHDAFQLLRREKFDLILCDLHMPFMVGEHELEFERSYEVGIRTVQELQKLLPSVPVLALTATSPLDIERIRRTLGTITVISKPQCADDLVFIVEDALQQNLMTAQESEMLDA